VTSEVGVTDPEAIRRIQRIQTFTIAWMVLETAASLWSAVGARSPALLAFGGDSAVELLSAVAVLWRFRKQISDENAERRAAWVTGILLLVLAVYVAVVSVLTLLGYSEPKPTYSGMAVLLAAAAVMPWLARRKRRLSSETGSAALRADAAESMLCAYLSLIALAGLGGRALLGVQWADPVAALVILPFVVWEAHEALRGRPCGCKPAL
jgi:divalent metal cation (Fe/Co/Zn/Cd) transporter